jgi:hypothetical protein
MNKTLRKSRNDFEEVTEKEKAYLESLKKEIQEKKEISDRFTIKKQELEILQSNIANKYTELQ